MKPEKIKSELDGLPPVEDLMISVPEDNCDLLGEVIMLQNIALSFPYIQILQNIVSNVSDY